MSVKKHGKVLLTHLERWGLVGGAGMYSLSCFTPTIRAEEDGNRHGPGPPFHKSPSQRPRENSQTLNSHSLDSGVGMATREQSADDEKNGRQEGTTTNAGGCRSHPPTPGCSLGGLDAPRANLVGVRAGDGPPPARTR